MEVTEIRISISDNKKTKAYVSITFDNILVVHGVKILDGKKGIFIAMPSKRIGDRFRDLVHPLNTEFRSIIQEKVLSEYKKMSQGRNDVEQVTCVCQSNS